MDRSGRTFVRVRRYGSGYLGTVEVPTDDGSARLRVVADAGSKAEALARAAAMAEELFKNPIVQAIIPPQAQSAVRSAKLLAAASRGGYKKLRSLWRRLKGPGKKRIAKALAQEAARVEGLDEVGFRLPWKHKRTKRAPSRFKRSSSVPPQMSRGMRSDASEPQHEEPEDYDDEEYADE